MTSLKSFGVKMQREVIKKILDMMAKEGIIRITHDPYAPDPAVEIWSRHDSTFDGRDLEYWRPSHEETKYYASEFDKCFDIAPRSDEK